MDRKLTRAVRVELALSVRQRYQSATSNAKKKMLAEFITVGGYHPKYAVHLLNAPGTTGIDAAPRRRVRQSLYDDAAKQALIELHYRSTAVGRA